ncbi:unnamed protein product [Cylindrotheca closterium]|uniref:Cytochrome b5 heme-binding domain-containing protein n=1 Tax=Cylindrotheca closterium TaxID=2856 RepID=A0AAD2GC56_9STRA|nr:unnamed protein product [Cylindrotheca closterium]
MISQALIKSSAASLKQQGSRSVQRWVSTSSTQASSLMDQGSDGNNNAAMGGKVAAAAVVAVAMVGLVTTTTTTNSTTVERTRLVSCEPAAAAAAQPAQQRTKMLGTSANSISTTTGGSKSSSSIEVRTAPTKSKMPVYTMKQVAVNNGENGKPVWMTHGGNVYDVTNFIANHPGGSEKIMQAAGSSVEPFWHVYRQHFNTDLPMKLMEQMLVGELLDKDQEKVDLKMELLEETTADPYALEPLEERHPALIVHGEQPMNAEVPEHLLTKDYLTSPDLFYIRHHHPVPYLTKDEVENFELEIDLGAYGGGKKKTITLEDLKKMKKVEVTATLQCSGNRRGGYNDFERTSGTSWGQGAISTAKWGGVRLRDLMKHIGLEDEMDAQENGKLEHVRFHALDGMMASIGIEKAMNPYGDVIVCYEMNGKPLPRDHGYPLRVIVPGYAAVRNVKWVQKIELSQEEAEGPWQRGLNYKVLPPGVRDAKSVDLSKIPSMMELSVQSGITSIVPQNKSSSSKPGDTIMVKASGWAYSGGGRNIVRVDVTGDGAESWQAADLTSGQDQKQGRAWAWTFWECTLPAKVQADGSVQVHSKGVDLAFNSQPDSAKHNWNVRGLTNNSWYSKKIPVQ